ncbi:MAG: NIL domain-containing protein [Egibacteraceae bacterium]
MATERWHLTFPGELVTEPVVSRLVSDHGLVINLRRADIDLEVGWIVLEVSGDDDGLAAGRAYLEEAGVSVVDPGGDVLLG